MADVKPPRSAGDAVAIVRGLLDYQRKSFVRKLDGVDEAEAARPVVPSGTTLLWLANHMGDAEVTWVLRRFAGQAHTVAEHAPTIATAVQRYQAIWAEVDEVLDRNVDFDQLCPPFDDQPRVSLRWIVTHLLQETARHAGHADILRELIDGHSGR